MDRLLSRRYRLSDFFFSLNPLDPAGHVAKIVSLARRFTVEVATHPSNSGEYQFLAGREILRWTGDVPIAPRYAVSGEGQRGRNLR